MGSNRQRKGSLASSLPRTYNIDMMCLLPIHPRCVFWCLAALATPTSVIAADDAVVTAGTYRGWSCETLGNGAVALQVVPTLGGRIMQFTHMGHDFLWVNARLTGVTPPSNGLAPDGGWLNYGGDKLWPAPQGWSSDDEWPGPPDGVLDGSPYVCERLTDEDGLAGLRLTSRDDPRSGMRLSRTVRLHRSRPQVSFTATMTNVDTRPRTWSIWSHTQLDGIASDGRPNERLRAYCPINPRSRFPHGYAVIFGDVDNPSFQADAATGLMTVVNRYRVGKIGLDSDAGWVATVDGVSGAVFVQRFIYEAGRDYADGASVEFWLNGVGTFHAYHRDITCPDDTGFNPPVFESEVLSPRIRLDPGRAYSWSWEWHATRVAPDEGVVACTVAGVVAKPLRIITAADGTVHLRGSFGVFASGRICLTWRDAYGRLTGNITPDLTVRPDRPFLCDLICTPPAASRGVTLTLLDHEGTVIGDLASALLP